MFLIRKNIIHSFIFLSFALCAGVDSARAENFQSGLESLAAKKPDEAIKSFGAHLAENPNDTSAMINLGIAHSMKAQWGMALAQFRSAKNLGVASPSLEQGLRYALDQLPIKDMPHETELWESFRAKVLVGVSGELLLLAFAFAIALFGKMLIGYWAKRRQCLIEDTDPPALTWFHLLSTFLFLSLAILVWANWIDDSETRATIIDEKVAARATSEAESASLFDLHQGFEVIVLRTQAEFSQVRYPGGPSGWIPSKSFMITQNKDTQNRKGGPL
jgi:hypothetical protein